MTTVIPHSLFTEFDISLFKSGKHFRLWEKLGSHLTTVNGVEGTYFAVWAPSAQAVSVVGDWNFWQEGEDPLLVRWDESGIWEGFIPNVGKGALYKYKIRSHHDDIVTEKADPFGRFCEIPPKTASIVWEEEYKWKDTGWMKNRHKHNGLDKPFAVYEVHLASWKKKNGWESLSYTELAKELVTYVKDLNFTHVEFMPIMEYPFDPSWGYQITGYFAPSSRFGTPEEFKYLVDQLHKNDIGVILDWVPSHFPEDDHGLGYFDGSHLYEHPDPRRGYHPDWKSLIFNYGRNEVRAFLISNALYWLEEFHADGLRVDAVASMLYLDYSREDGEWEPNMYGNNENLEALSFIREFNSEVYARFPDVQTIAEESTAFTGVSLPVHYGGLGFGMKWMMGWMHDTLEYFKKDPIHRKYHQNEITFSLAYAFTENFMLPLSHDEVVYGKKSLIYRMPGDEWQRFANLRLLFGYMYTHPGAKLLFMGGEFGQTSEWDFQAGLEWRLLEYPVHRGIQSWVRDLNFLYRTQPALHEKQFSHEGFRWLEYNDSENSVICYVRTGHREEESVVAVCNFTPVTRVGYRIGLPDARDWHILLSSDSEEYQGTGYPTGPVNVDEMGWHGCPQSTVLDLPPLSIMVLK